MNILLQYSIHFLTFIHFYFTECPPCQNEDWFITIPANFQIARYKEEYNKAVQANYTKLKYWYWWYQWNQTIVINVIKRSFHRSRPSANLLSHTKYKMCIIHIKVLKTSKSSLPKIMCSCMWHTQIEFYYSTKVVWCNSFLPNRVCENW